MWETFLAKWFCFLDESDTKTEWVFPVECADNSVKKSAQKQKYVKGWDKDGAVYTSYSVKSVDVITRQIGILEQLV